MSELSSREKLFKDYSALQQKAQDYVTKNTTRDEQISPLMDSLKKLATPREAYDQMNVAQVVLNTRAMDRIMGQIQPTPTKSKRTRSLTQSQTGGAPFRQSSLKVIQSGLKLTQPEDINAQAANYLLTMAESQAIGGELETFATAVQNGKEADSDLLTQVQSGVTSIGGRVENILGRLADRAKTVGESFWNAIKGISEKAKTVAGNVREFIVSSIKELADNLREFITALIGAIFDLAAWIQSIATTKGFTIRTLPLRFSLLKLAWLLQFQYQSSQLQSSMYRFLLKDNRAK